MDINRFPILVSRNGGECITIYQTPIAGIAAYRPVHTQVHNVHLLTPTQFNNNVVVPPAAFGRGEG